MSDFQRCPNCKEYGFLSGPVLRHVCKPEWECRGEWDGDDEWWNTIHASDSEQAAEKFAEHYDCSGGEYAIVGGKFRKDVIVLVRKSEGEEIERFAIEAEAVPTYRATKLTPVISD